MTPKEQEILNEIEATLVNLGCNQITKDIVIKKLIEYNQFLTFPFTANEFIAFAGARVTNNNIEAAIKFTKIIMEFGYTTGDICKVGSITNGHARLECLYRYHGYLKSLNFSNDDIVEMLTSKSGQRTVYAIIATYDTLVQLGFKVSDVMTIAHDNAGLRLFAKIEENKDKFVNKLPQEIILNVTTKKSLPKGMVVNDPDIDYSSQMQIKSEALLNQYHIEQHYLNAQSTQSHKFQPALRFFKDIIDEKLSENKVVSQSSHSMPPFLELNTGENDETLLENKEVGYGGSSMPPLSGLNTGSNDMQPTTHVEKRVRMTANQLNDIFEKLYEQLILSRFTPAYADLRVAEMAPYIVQLHELGVTLANISRMAIVKSIKPVIKSFLKNQEVLQSFGYSVNELAAIIVREAGEKTVLALRKFHVTLTSEGYGFSREQLIDIVKHGRGERNLLALINHYATLKNKLNLSNEKIVQVSHHYNGHENIIALIEYYDVLINLKYNPEQIISMAIMSSARNRFVALIAYHTFLTNKGFKHHQLVGMITANDSVSAISYLYYYLQKLTDKSFKIDYLVKLIIKKDYKDFMTKNGVVLPGDLYNTNLSMANLEVGKLKRGIARFAKMTQAPALMPTAINTEPLKAPAVVTTTQSILNVNHHKTSRDTQGKNIHTQKKSKQVNEEIYETSIGSETQPVALPPYLEDLQYRDAHEWRLSVETLSPYSLFATPHDLQISDERSEALQTTELVTQSTVATNTQDESATFNIDDFLLLPDNPELDELMEMMPLEPNQPPHGLGNH